MENKIQVIKAIREITNYGLQEALYLANDFDEGKATQEQIAIVHKAQKLAEENMANAKKQQEEYKRSRQQLIRRAISAIMINPFDHDELIKDALEKHFDNDGWTDAELQLFINENS